MCQSLCQQMMRQTPRRGNNRDRIVNIANAHSIAAFPGAGPYDAAKWGVGFSKAIAVELATQGIRINAVSPGLINTQIWKCWLMAV